MEGLEGSGKAFPVEALWRKLSGLYMAREVLSGDAEPMDINSCDRMFSLALLSNNRMHVCVWL